MLTVVGWEPSQGKTPRFITFDPAGKVFYVANQDSDSIVAFRADPEIGKLSPTGLVVNTGSPVCILFREG